MTESLCKTQMATLLENCSDAIFLLDQDKTLISHNKAANKLMDHSHQDNVAEIQRLLVEQKSIQLTNSSGEERIYQALSIPLPDSPENNIHSAHILRDITHQQQLASERDTLAEQLATERITDPATGLLNQRGLMLALEPQLSRCRRYGNTVSVICLDVCGDGNHSDLIIAISQMLKDQLRWADLVSHIENDIFLIALPETGINESTSLTKKIDEHLNRLIQEEISGDNQQIWSYYGVAEWRKNDHSKTLIERAILNMKHEKNEQNSGALAS
ncbi:MAG: sensor domain-containing diguanylate cyclase [Gammaproteobacteria bacterium]|nr:sensor domain-containing diguanylate cyclase [Gammaproteobacteria bacterium]